MFRTANRPLVLLQALLFVALTLVDNGLACSKNTPAPAKVFVDPRIKEVSEHTCFAAEALRVDDQVPSFATQDLGNKLSYDSCRDFCIQHGYEGKIIALTPTDCHCNKYFKEDGQRDESKCDVPCRGDSQTLCGSVGYVSAYPAR